MSIDMMENQIQNEQKQTTEYVVQPVRPSGTMFYRVVKRAFDFAISLAMCLVLLVPMLLIALLIRLESPGPGIFTQQRMGKGGKVFKIYKFRTMRLDAPSELATSWFTNSEEYITKIGAFLRRTSIDELPQLINIMKGDMSFIGYRPVCLTEVKLNKLREQYGVFAVKPGLTGLAQVRGRENLGYKEKARIDAEYVSNRGFKLDLWCLIKTVEVVITGEGAR